VYHKEDSLRLTRGNPLRRAIRARALRRFLQGYPPRKTGDTSIGDAMNWEWILHCAEKPKSDVVIVSRDSDYGIRDGAKSYLNDHLKQEFSERISPRRKVIWCTRLSDGLKTLQVPVTQKEKAAEDRLIETAPTKTVSATFSPSFEATNTRNSEHLNQVIEGILRSVAIVQEVTGQTAVKSTASGKSE
jgi:hypothetical protein